MQLNDEEMGKIAGGTSAGNGDLNPPPLCTCNVRMKYRRQAHIEGCNVEVYRCENKKCTEYGIDKDRFGNRIL
ncbi:MAG: hypothetical protein K6G16_04145 [Lachnospiraceae bacterium]|nr:hypothetical protein [Lachnospiraceae bacterium]